MPTFPNHSKNGSLAPGSFQDGWRTSFNYWKTSCWMHSLTFKRNSRTSRLVKCTSSSQSKQVLQWNFRSYRNATIGGGEKKEVFFKTFFLVVGWWRQQRRERFRSCTWHSVRIRVSLWVHYSLTLLEFDIIWLRYSRPKSGWCSPTVCVIISTIYRKEKHSVFYENTIMIVSLAQLQ